MWTLPPILSFCQTQKNPNKTTKSLPQAEKKLNEKFTNSVQNMKKNLPTLRKDKFVIIVWIKNLPYLSKSKILQKSN